MSKTQRHKKRKTSVSTITSDVTDLQNLSHNISLLQEEVRGLRTAFDRQQERTEYQLKHINETLQGIAFQQHAFRTARDFLSSGVPTFPGYNNTNNYYMANNNINNTTANATETTTKTTNNKINDAASNKKNKNNTVKTTIKPATKINNKNTGEKTDTTTTITTTKTTAANKNSNNKNKSSTIGSTCDSTHATLSEDPKTLQALWEEYDVGIDGRKPAKNFTISEIRQNNTSYYHRKIVWDVMARMTQMGWPPLAAIGKIYGTYGGSAASVHDIISEIKKDNEQKIQRITMQPYKANNNSRRAKNYNNSIKIPPPCIPRQQLQHRAPYNFNGSYPLHPPFIAQQLQNRVPYNFNNNFHAAAAAAAAATSVSFPKPSNFTTNAANNTINKTTYGPTGTDTITTATTTTTTTTTTEISDDTTLSENPKTLWTLWNEYEYGIDGRKPAKLFTPAEREKVGTEYCRRNHIWDQIKKMIEAGWTVNGAIYKIYNVYGRIISPVDASKSNSYYALVGITPIIKQMQKDKKAGIERIKIETERPTNINDNENDNNNNASDGAVVVNDDNDDNEAGGGDGCTENDDIDHAATLSTHPRTLKAVWDEYEYGLEGRKPAKLFTPSERGKVKYQYHRRKVIWDKIKELMNTFKISSDDAINKIYDEYGYNNDDDDDGNDNDDGNDSPTRKASVTIITNRLRKDRQQQQQQKQPDDDNDSDHDENGDNDDINQDNHDGTKKTTTTVNI